MGVTPRSSERGPVRGNQIDRARICVRTECSSVLVAGPVALRHANVHLARTPEETLRARSRTRSKPFRRRDRREGADRAVRGVGEGARLAVLAALLVVANHV